METRETREKKRLRMIPATLNCVVGYMMVLAWGADQHRKGGSGRRDEGVDFGHTVCHGSVLHPKGCSQEAAGSQSSAGAGYGLDRDLRVTSIWQLIEAMGLT